MRTKKLAIFATHPIQYQVPIWRKLAATPGLEVRVFYGTDMSVRGYKDDGFGVNVSWDTPLLEGYESTFLSRDPSIQRVDFWKPNAKGLDALIDAFKPDVGFLVAYRSTFHLGAWWALNSRGIPVIMRHEATDVAHSRRWLTTKLRNVLLQSFYARMKCFAFIGSEARQHLVRLGVDESRLFHAPYCVDSDFIAKQIQDWSPQREKLRKEMGIKTNDRVFVFSGKLLDKKDPLLIAEALEKMATSSSASDQEALERIHIVVDGALKIELESRLRAVIGPRAHFLGLLNQSKIGEAYAIGDALILASKRGSGETWGLVVNEAMQWGLPAIVSDGVGCGVDLVDEKTTGRIFQTGNSSELAVHMREYALIDEVEKETMRNAAVEKVAGHSINHALSGLHKAIKAAVNDNNTKLY